jgi:type VI protein secretion system component VasK
MALQTDCLYHKGSISSTMETTSRNNKMPEGLGARVTVSIVAFFGAVIGTILWLFFYAQNFNVYQNIAVVAVILIGFIAAMAATWAAWGMRQAARQSEKGSC